MYTVEDGKKVIHNVEAAPFKQGTPQAYIAMPDKVFL